MRSISSRLTGGRFPVGAGNDDQYDSCFRDGHRVSVGVSTPGHGQGEGPDGYKLFAEQMTQETLGGAGVERHRRGTESHEHPMPIPPST